MQQVICQNHATTLFRFSYQHFNNFNHAFLMKCYNVPLKNIICKFGRYNFTEGSVGHWIECSLEDSYQQARLENTARGSCGATIQEYRITTEEQILQGIPQTSTHPIKTYWKSKHKLRSSTLVYADSKATTEHLVQPAGWSLANLCKKHDSPCLQPSDSHPRWSTLTADTLSTCSVALRDSVCSRLGCWKLLLPKTHFFNNVSPLVWATVISHHCCAYRLHVLRHQTSW